MRAPSFTAGMHINLKYRSAQFPFHEYNTSALYRLTAMTTILNQTVSSRNIWLAHLSHTARAIQLINSDTFPAYKGLVYPD